jgi:hypothetical protein
MLYNKFILQNYDTYFLIPTSQKMYLRVKAWKKKVVAPRLKSFPRITFSIWKFFIGLYYIFHIVFKVNIKFEAKYDI